MSNEMTTNEETAVVDNNDGRRTIQPRVDIRETAANYVLAADLPGVAEGDIDITLEKDQLTLTAPTRVASAENLAHQEFAPANYRRTFTISEAIDRENITASLADGVLTLVLAKRPEQQPRKISVQVA